MHLPSLFGTSTASVLVKGKPLLVEWTRAADRELANRDRPLVIELELYFSCLVKKFVHFHDDAAGRVGAQKRQARLHRKPMAG